MAMIKCIECGGMISDKSEACIHCGSPTNISFIKKELLKCPKCGSAAITTGTRGVSLLMGFVGSNKTVNRCGSCGNSWKPGDTYKQGEVKK